MSDPKNRGKEEEEKHITKTREYRRFRKLLKQVVKAPPMRKKRETAHNET